MKTLTVREAYDWLYVDEQSPIGLTYMEWDNLLYFLEEKYNGENVVEVGNRRLRFINLVGVIQLNTVRIEILPKINLSHEESVVDRRALLNMLSITKQLPVQLNNQTISQYEKIDLSHLLAYLFVTELYKAIKRGIYRDYKQKRENLKHLKGRLLVTQHIQKNANQSIHAFCEYDELSVNVHLNQVLKAALRVIFPFIQNSNLRIQSMMIFELYEEVDDVYVDTNMLRNIAINRQNQHFKNVLALAEAILKSKSMNTENNNQIAFSFLFKMNDLYEAYVGECLSMLLAPTTSYKLDLQHKEKRLLINIRSGRENIALKPDFVVSKIEDNEAIPILILDTKWKSIFSGTNINYNQADIYQMYAYITAYQTAKRCIILYPNVLERSQLPKWKVPEVIPEKYIELTLIRLDQVENTVADLGKVIFSKGQLKI
ncbi:McrC family protein [Bacillus sinesaloumensis]|uniref:McrC family protein n=1 Tax=Litchfieldia sinesaloumensis TaxID=1926280 RepID=UPI00098853EB|nr:hypothetical protein [Bacillus sinesaloumensis]